SEPGAVVADRAAHAPAADAVADAAVPAGGRARRAALRALHSESDRGARAGEAAAAAGRAGDLPIDLAQPRRAAHPGHADRAAVLVPRVLQRLPTSDGGPGPSGPGAGDGRVPAAP